MPVVAAALAASALVAPGGQNGAEVGGGSESGGVDPEDALCWFESR
jgi:hypothetical protein